MPRKTLPVAPAPLTEGQPPAPAKRQSWFTALTPEQRTELALKANEARKAKQQVKAAHFEKAMQVAIDTVPRTELLPPPAPPPTTGETVMKLRARIAALTGQAWYTVVMLNPLFEDVPTSPFTVKMRATKELVGQWPADTSDEALEQIANEVVAIFKGSVAATTPETDEEGNVVADPRVVGKVVRLRLANGEDVDIVPQRRVPVETDASEDARVRRMIDESPRVDFAAATTEQVIWNGHSWTIHEGENVGVPAMFKDVYFEALRGRRANIQRALQPTIIGGRTGLPEGVLASADMDPWLWEQGQFGKRN